jgi:hypothetical protein
MRSFRDVEIGMSENKEGSDELMARLVGCNVRSQGG